jgi:hypothetical protein
MYTDATVMVGEIKAEILYVDPVVAWYILEQHRVEFSIKKKVVIA